jgi:hypothetical protein
MLYNATRLDGELRAAGLPIAGCSSDGRIDWLPGHPTPQEEAAAAAVLAAHDPTPVPAPDPDAELKAAIEAAQAEIERTATLEEMKVAMRELTDALLGKSRSAMVKGRAVEVKEDS